MRKALTILVIILVLSGLFSQSCLKTTLTDSNREEALLTEIPLRLYGSVILMELSIDESGPLTFIFDTGAGGTIINENTAVKLGIVGNETVSRTGGTGSATVVLSDKHTLGIGELSFQDVTLGITYLEHIEKRFGISIDGVIGWEILSQYAVRIDCDTKLIGIYDNRKYEYDFGDSVYPVEVQGTTIFTDITVTFNSGSTFNGKVIVDTGANKAFLFNTPFVDENNLLSEIDTYYMQETKSLSTESSLLYTTMLASVNLGEYVFTKVPANLAIAESGAFSWSGPMGILGNEILKRFNIFINLRQNMISLEPNQLYHEQFQINCSGLEIGMDDTFQKVIIENVINDSPAEKSGLKIDDEIIKIKGIRVSTLQLRDIRDMLIQPGEEVEILVDRKGELYSYTFVLQSLLD